MNLYFYAHTHVDGPTYLYILCKISSNWENLGFNEQ